MDNINDTIRPMQALCPKWICGHRVEGDIKFLNQRQYMSVHKDAEFDGLAKHIAFVDKNQTALVFSNKGNCYKLKTEIYLLDG